MKNVAPDYVAFYQSLEYWSLNMLNSKFGSLKSSSLISFFNSQSSQQWPMKSLSRFFPDERNSETVTDQQSLNAKKSFP